MAPEKTTIMLLKVDLECDKCYQKVKRTLCCFPQVRDQMYKEKENVVMIKVVCCSPEKIRDRISAKGGRSIKSIQIVESQAPPPPDSSDGGKPPKPAPAPPSGDKPKDKGPPPPQAAADKPKDKPAPPPAADKPKDKPPSGGGGGGGGGGPPPDKIQKSGSKNGSGPKPDQQGGGKPAPAPAQDKPAKPDPKPAAAPAPQPMPPQQQQPLPPQAMMQSVPMGIAGYPPPPGIYPVNMQWGPYYDGQPAGMYPPPHMSDPYGGYNYGSGSGGWNTRPPHGPYCNPQSDYFSDENPQACVIM